MTLLDTLRTASPTLSPRESAVAEVILADPAGVLKASVAELAARAQVSQPTIIRLCRHLGCEGFADFKLKLAACLAPGTPFVSASVQPGDGPSVYVARVFDAAIHALQVTRNAVDPRILEEVVGCLATARRILVFGLGGSAPTALDAQHKLGRFPAPCQAVSDPIQARMGVVDPLPGDVLLVVSNTGRTLEVVEVATLARRAGMCVAAITAPSSPLAQVASYVLGIEPVEDADYYTPMASRLAHLALVDALATGVALRLGSSLTPRLARIKESLRETRLKRR